MSEGPLGDALRGYLEAAGREDAHALAARRRRLLPRIREEGADLAGAAELRAAVAVLSEAEAAAFGPLPESDRALREGLAARLATLKPSSWRVPVLLVDVAGGAGVLSELTVEIVASQGRGSVLALGSADEAATTAARRAVTAATALLRRLGYSAEASDLEVSWQVGGARDAVVGPSIGLAVGLAVVARATGRPIPPDVAVTGELALDGHLVPVAGVGPKLAAAADAGIGRVLVPPGSDGRGAVPLSTLDEAAELLWGLGVGRSTPLVPAPLVITTVALVALTLGLLEIPALLGYPAGVAPLPDEALSDRVVLVTWSRDDDPAAAQSPAPLASGPVAPADPASFADHKSYRATHPVVLARLADAGASVVAFDVWFRGGDASSLEALRASVAATRAAGAEVILPARSSAGRWDGPDPALASAATAVASAELIREQPGGLVRQAAVGWRDPADGAPEWSVAAAAVAAAQGTTPKWNGPDVLVLGDRALSAPAGRRLLRFPDRPGFRHYAYSDVYGGRFDPAHFADALVLVGGRLGTQDRHRTPAGDWYGVEVLALSVQDLLGDDALVRVGMGARAGGLVVVGLLFAAVLALRRRRDPAGWPVWGLGGLVACGLAVLVAQGLSGAGLYWPWTDAALLLVALCAWGAWGDRARRRALVL